MVAVGGHPNPTQRGNWEMHGGGAEKRTWLGGNIPDNHGEKNAHTSGTTDRCSYRGGCPPKMFCEYLSKPIKICLTRHLHIETFYIYIFQLLYSYTFLHICLLNNWTEGKYMLLYANIENHLAMWPDLLMAVGTPGRRHSFFPCNLKSN